MSYNLQTILSLKRFLLCLLLLFLGVSKVDATHIVGGELTYTQVDDEEYLVRLVVYRDCGATNTNGTPFDDFVSVGVYLNGNYVTQLSLPLSDAEVSLVPVTLENPCFVLPPDVCVEKAIFEGYLELPEVADSYDLVYQRCCRNPSIINLVNPDDSGATFWTQIPGTNLTTEYNSCPQYLNFPPVALCLGASFVFDHSALDIDGDELTYEFCTPLLGGSPEFPSPVPPDPPPFNNVVWGPGYSVNYPIDSDPAFNIDANTGLITGTPTQTGQFVVGVCVKEYRNGVLLSNTNRDFQFNVTICDPTIVASIPAQEQFCEGLTFEFSQESENASSFYWDFGDPSTTSDTSTDPNPVYTYQDTGIYTVMLVANPNWPCADTTFSEYAVYPLISPAIFQSDFACQKNQIWYDFNAGGSFDSDAEFAWDFGPNANVNFSDDQSPENITFNGALTYEVSLTVFDNGCEASVTELFEVPPQPVAELEGQEIYCDGLTFDFENLSENATSYSWDFGVPGLSNDMSALTNPSYTYADTGVYTVTLIASSDFTCSDTVTAEYAIYWLLDPYFETPPAQCFEGNAFSFEAMGFEESSSEFEWEFGALSNMPTSVLVNPSGISFAEPGTFPIGLTISANGCVDSYNSVIEILPNPTINFNILESSGCPPLLVHVLDSAFAATQITYLWEFGDGGISNIPNPTHIYNVPGTYDITLTMSTTEGCIETLQMTEFNAVTVFPEPQAGFDVNPNTVNILEPEVEITDLSEGSISCYYTFEDGGSSSDCDFFYSFSQSGYMDVYQTVVNEYGCLDVAHALVAVEGFLFYVPNSFTPNNDGINDVFKPVFTGISSYRIEIHDRWGEIVFTSDDPYEPWLGNVKEGEHFAADGVYIYHIVVEDLLFYPREFTGHISLLR
jgi:gliding motility-associated-like protein